MITETYEVTADGKKILSTKKYKGVQRFIGNSLLKTWQGTPLVSGFLKLEASKVIELKDKLKKENKNVTYTSIFLKLLSSAVEKHPGVNSALVGERIETYKSINVGFAVGTPDELLYVPVIKDTEEKNIFEISDEMKTLIRKIMNNTISQEELSGGTITMSSLGMYDSWGMTQILVPPQSIILGFGSIKKEPVVLEDDTIGVGNIIYVSTTSDHRVLQGEPIAQFTTTLIDHFNNPEDHMGL